MIEDLGRGLDGRRPAAPVEAMHVLDAHRLGRHPGEHMVMPEGDHTGEDLRMQLVVGVDPVHHAVVEPE